MDGGGQTLYALSGDVGRRHRSLFLLGLTRRMNFPSTLIVAFAAALLGCGCSPTVTIHLADVSKTNIVNLVTQRYPTLTTDRPSGIRVRVYGKIDGTAYIYNPQWGTNKLSGTVDWSRVNDWFSTNCVFLYMPDRVNSGRLTFESEFW